MTNTNSDRNALLKIVIADDEPSILEGIRSLIDRSGLPVTITGAGRDGEEALQTILLQVPDIVILDIKMPKLTGIEVIRKVRLSGLSCHFIILSGYSDFSYAKECIHYGVQAYLLKPVNKDELFTEIQNVIIKRNSADPSAPPLPVKRPASQIDTLFLNNLLDNKIWDDHIIMNTLYAHSILLTNTECEVCFLDFSPCTDEEKNEIQAVYDKLNASFINKKQFFWLYSSTRIAGIFNTDSLSMEEIESTVSEILSDMQKETTFLCFGDPVHRLAECPYSFTRAQAALSYRIYETGFFLNYKMICTTPPTLRPDQINYLPVIQAVVQNNKQNIEQFCESYFNSILYTKMPPPNYVQGMCFSLINTIEQELSSFSNQNIQASTDVKALYSFHSLSAIRSWLTNSLLALSDYVEAFYGYSSQSKEPEPVSMEPNTEKSHQYKELLDTLSKEDSILAAAYQYIEENINSRLSVNDIAKQIHLSPSYFAIYFKNKTGLSLKNFIMVEKMEYAKKRLADRNCSVNELADELGYTDYRSFSRAFKTLCGTTPSEYQSSLH